MDWQPTVEQTAPPRLDRNVLIRDRAAKRFGIFLGVEIHILGLGARQVIDLADVRLRIGEDRGYRTCHISDCDRRGFALAEW